MVSPPRSSSLSALHRRTDAGAPRRPFVSRSSRYWVVLVWLISRAGHLGAEPLTIPTGQFQTPTKLGDRVSLRDAVGAVLVTDPVKNANRSAHCWRKANPKPGAEATGFPVREIDLPSAERAGRNILVPLLAADSQSSPADYVCIERLSSRVVLAYWRGTDRRCSLTAIQSSKGLAIVDTEVSPRIMAPIKQRIEKIFGRSDWIYVINTHAHDNHAGGNSLFQGATIVGHENLAEDMQWLIDKQGQPEWKQRDLDRIAGSIRNLRALLPQAAGSQANTRPIHGEIGFWELHARDLREGYQIVKPSLTFSGRHTLDLGDLQLELVFFGKGHSLSDTLVYIPQEKLLVTGAIVYQRGQLPEIGARTELRDVERFLTILDGFLAPDVRIDRVVPSHSPPLLKLATEPFLKVREQGIFAPRLRSSYSSREALECVVAIMAWLG